MFVDLAKISSSMIALYSFGVVMPVDGTNFYVKYLF